MTDLQNELKKFVLQPIQVLDEYEIRKVQPGQVTMEVRVKQDSLNPYQLAQ